MKKITLGIAVGLLSFTGISFALQTFNYEGAKNIAQDYVKNSLLDENWKNSNPQVGEGKYFYTDSDSPSYIEFKITCEKEPNCGFVMVNFDGNDVSIPIASTSGNTPSEILSSQLENTGNTFYYFSPFEQYAENNISGEVTSILPEEKEILGETSSEQKNLRDKRNIKLKEKLNQAKKDSKNFKKSSEFRKIKKELKEKKQTIPENEISFKILPLLHAGSTEIVGNGKYVGGTSTANCNSRVPCYKQFTYNYNNQNCLSGCAATAVGILFGYHDRVGNYPNLVSGTAKDFITSSTTDTNITTLINDIRTRIDSFCDSNGGGATAPDKIKNAYSYAVSKGYLSSNGYYGTGTPSGLLTLIQTEINKGNPIIITTLNHALVAYGYNTTSGSNMIRVNYGWGNGTYSNSDVNINSINVNGSSYSVLSTTRFDIK